MTLSDFVLPTMDQTLRALDSWLEKGAAFERAAGRDPDEMVDLRLAPDMYPLATQVLFCCFQAREVVHRLRGEEIPEPTLQLRTAGWAGGEGTGNEGARERIATTLQFLAAVEPMTLDEGASKPIALELPSGHVFDMTGERFVRDWAVPQYFFHLVTAYAILRNRGVALGKVDYVPWMFAYLRPGTGPSA
jgi:hypothetical protein